MKVSISPVLADTGHTMSKDGATSAKAGLNMRAVSSIDVKLVRMSRVAGNIKVREFFHQNERNAVVGEA